jgi:hypothetical protein
MVNVEVVLNTSIEASSADTPINVPEVSITFDPVVVNLVNCV